MSPALIFFLLCHPEIEVVEKEIKIHPFLHMQTMLYVRFSMWLLWEPSMVLCEDPNQLAWGGVTCQRSYFLSQSLGKHGRATKPALEEGEEARGL